MVEAKRRTIAPSRRDVSLWDSRRGHRVTVGTGQKNPLSGEETPNKSARSIRRENKETAKLMFPRERKKGTKRKRGKSKRERGKEGGVSSEK